MKKLLLNYLTGIKKTILYALGLSIIIVALLLYINNDGSETMISVIFAVVGLLMFYIGLYSVYFLFKIKRFDLLFFILLWSILHIILIVTGCYEGYGDYYGDYYSSPDYNEPDFLLVTFLVKLANRLYKK